MTRALGTAGIVLLLAVGGCGSRRPTASSQPAYAANGPQQAAAPTPELRGNGSAADPFQLCHMNGGPGRTDYAFVAGWHCPDGSQPLGGDPARGAQARVGNVGPGPDGHIVDLYEVPCAVGPVHIHVDAYHCGGVDTEIDMSRLSRAQLLALAEGIRQMHRDPSSARSLEMRRELLMWALETRQLTIVICPAVFQLVPGEGARHPYVGELTLSYAAAVIEDGRDPADPTLVTARALEGVAVYYQAILAIDPGARDPQMDRLLATAQQGGLPALAQSAVAQCGSDWGGLGVHFYR